MTDLALASTGIGSAVATSGKRAAHLIFLAIRSPAHSRGVQAEAYVLGLVTRVMIFAIAALSLDLLIGYGALISFGTQRSSGSAPMRSGFLARTASMTH
jgi:ABC-type branched-subunit amino acid transport system permease subunit